MKLNNPCPICNKKININDNTVYKDKILYHLDCYMIKIKEIENRLLSLNQQISFKWIGLKQKPNESEIMQLNKSKSLDELDIKILEELKKDNSLGTIELSRKIEIAPKNLIRRLKKQIELEVILKDKEPLKPKGWKRLFIVTKKGEFFIKSYNDSVKASLEFDRNENKK
jgi:DNA-binding HxlR family transcriptional regulator